MDITVIVHTLTPLADAFEFYGIPYHLTGSLATSVYVQAQAVQGIEVVSDIKFSQVPALVVQLENTYDVKEIALRWNATMGVGSASSVSGRASWRSLLCKEVRLILLTCGCGRPRLMSLSSSSKQ